MSKYDELYQFIMSDIKNGKYSQGQKLPSENMLCMKHDLSRQTVRKALSKLEEDGLIKREKGKGSFVTYNYLAENPPKEKIIGVFLSFLDNYIFPNVLIGIEKTLQKADYSILLGLGHNRVQNETLFLQKALSENVSGIIVEGVKSSFPNPNESYYNELKKNHIPVLFVNNFYQNIEAPSVLLDDYNLACEITQLLIRHGHKNIAGIFKFDDIQGLRRYGGFTKALVSNQIELREDYICWYETTESENSKKKLNKCLDEYAALVSDWCTAIVCYNDLIAGKLTKRLRGLGFRIPEDISVVGFDNSDIMHSYDINLTTIHHPKEEMGVYAAKTMLEYIAHPSETNYVRKFLEMPSRIVHGESIMIARNIENPRHI